MKKRILLFTASIILGSALIMSYQTGPATLGYNLTGAVNGAQSGCMQTNCHIGGAYTNGFVSVTLYDSTGSIQMNTWKPNYAHKAVFSISNCSSPKIGFQISVGYYNGTDTVMAGTMSNASLGLHFFTAQGFQVLEHSSPITVTGSQVTRNFEWLSPNATSIDTILFFVAVNNVDGNGAVTNDNSSVYVMKVGRNTASVKEVGINQRINAYPNPFTDKLNIKMENVASGTYTINILDLRGKVIATETANVNKNHETSVNTEKWAAGMYYVNFRNGTATQTMVVVKQ